VLTVLNVGSQGDGQPAPGGPALALSASGRVTIVDEGKMNGQFIPLGPCKFLLAAHLTASAGWIGAIMAYLALGIAARTSQDAQTVRAAWIALLTSQTI